MAYQFLDLDFDGVEHRHKDSNIQFKEFSMNFGGENLLTVKAPVFAKSGSFVFSNLNTSKDERFGKLLSALFNHEKDKPKHWDLLVSKVQSEPDELKKLKLVNAVLNKVPYKDGTDGTYYHPAKFYRKGGVCKDFALAKYLLLKDSGYPVDQLRIAVLSPKIDNPNSPLHVVLVVKANGSDFVLDLKPAYLAQQERMKLGTTKEKQIMEIREAGLDFEDVDSYSPVGFYALKKYVSERGLLWTGNETGFNERFEESKLRKKK
jgi:predicted transglutaminase-like cysteine proteinase